MESDRPVTSLESHLAALFGHARFRAGQREVVECALAGMDTLAVLPTGGGKSVTYQLPAMLLPGVTLILSPLIALMKDQAEGLPPAVAGRTTFINSSLDYTEVTRRLRRVASGGVRLVYAAPERLRQVPFLHLLKEAGVSLLVVDEAHCISQWGHDFRPDYRAVGRAVQFLEPKVILAVTATATPRVRDDIERQLGRRLKRIVRPTFRENLHLSCRHLASESDKMLEVGRLCRELDGVGLVYAGTRDKCEEIARNLQRQGVAAGYYHAGLPAELRAATQDRFMAGEIRVMVATVAFGMGVDKPDIRELVHYHPSRTLENYYQEAGRAGRDGLPSRCTLLFSRSDAVAARRMMRDNEIGMEDLKALFHAVRGRCAAPTQPPAMRCARVAWDDLAAEVSGGENVVRAALPVLEEVGLLRRYADIPRAFHLSGGRAGAAAAIDDAHLRLLVGAAEQGGSWGPAELSAYSGVPWPDLELALLRLQEQGALSYRTGQRDMLFEVLPTPHGARDSMTAMLRRRSVETEFRVNAMLSYARTHECRHAVIGRYFGDSDSPSPFQGEGMGEILFPEGVSPSGRSLPVMDDRSAPRESSFPPLAGGLRGVSGPAAHRCGMCDTCDGVAKPFAAAPRPRPVRHTVASDSQDASDGVLYAALREWRSATARELKLPGYCVFPDRVLTAIASQRPQREEDLLLIPGIGIRKAAKYGEEVLRIVQAHGP